MKKGGGGGGGAKPWLLFRSVGLYFFFIEFQCQFLFAKIGISLPFLAHVSLLSEHF